MPSIDWHCSWLIAKECIKTGICGDLQSKQKKKTVRRKGRQFEVEFPHMCPEPSPCSGPQTQKPPSQTHQNTQNCIVHSSTTGRLARLRKLRRAVASYVRTTGGPARRRKLRRPACRTLHDGPTGLSYVCTTARSALVGTYGRRPVAHSYDGSAGLSCVRTTGRPARRRTTGRPARRRNLRPPAGRTNVRRAGQPDRRPVVRSRDGPAGPS